MHRPQQVVLDYAAVRQKETAMLSWLMRRFGGQPAFRIYGKGQSESTWRTIDVFASRRRNLDSRWPFFGATCITWSDSIVAVGWDFAESVIREQMANPASRDRRVILANGQLHPERFSNGLGSSRRLLTGSEILAHECGHTVQARRFGFAYLVVGATFTWWREGSRWWNWFENEASAIGQFGGIISESVHAELWSKVRGGR
jgi:hypothetical protein